MIEGESKVITIDLAVGEGDDIANYPQISMILYTGDRTCPSPVIGFTLNLQDSKLSRKVKWEAMTLEGTALTVNLKPEHTQNLLKKGEVSKDLKASFTYSNTSRTVVKKSPHEIILVKVHQSVLGDDL